MVDDLLASDTDRVRLSERMADTGDDNGWKLWHGHRHYKSHVIDGDFIRNSLIKYTEL